MFQRIPNYRLNMGFGIHVGWGIEGAIGSPYKIDASYLSPNVNISARLEAATRQYGISILIPGELQSLLTEPYKKVTRLIDIVTVKGSAQPMKFYTVNLKETSVAAEEDPMKGWTRQQKRKALNEAKVNIQALTNNIITTQELLEEDEDLKLMMKEHMSNKEEFLNEYDTGFKAYLDGDWKKAIKHFRTCRDLNPEDGPVRTLIHFVESYNCDAQIYGWEGFRKLTSK